MLPDMPDATGQRARDYYCLEVGVFEKREYLDLYHHVLAIIIIQSKTIFSPVHSCARHIAFQLTSHVPGLSGTANPPFIPSRVSGFPKRDLGLIPSPSFIELTRGPFVLASMGRRVESETRSLVVQGRRKQV